jgi:hypothetical protein
MKDKIIDGLLTVTIFTVISLMLGLLVLSMSSCGSTQSCAAYKDKPKVERTEQKSKASDPKPRISRGYVQYNGAR